VIRLVGGLVQQAAGASALVSRISGDRFAVALPQSTLNSAREVGAAILDATGQLGYVRGAEALPVSVSIGAVVGVESARLSHLLAAAELACKRAKLAGAGRLEAMEDLGLLSPALTRQSLAAVDLDEALKSNQFQLEAQPVVGLRGRVAETVGYELLARMRGPGGELVAPDKFLDACAEYGLLPALDRWAVYAAVETLRPHAGALAGSPVFFSLNVSGQSVANRKYAAFALDTLAGAGLAPGLFTFEIKEAAAVANLRAAETFIRDVTAAGAKVALDDFGSGLSSLAYLKHLPVSYLKIDGLFVRRMIADRVSESIVSALARAARTLGLLTIAEQVESADVAERLRELDVTLAQGFHFGRPAPFGQVLQQLLTAASPVRAATHA
jgi:EAL domain-containing protein (putative c-di-GMP-specific phosphodiesterase class I)